MHIGKILGSVYLAHFSGLAIILVPKRTTGTRTTVKKRKAGLGNLFQWGLGPMRADMWRRGVLAQQAVLLATYLSHEDKVFVRDDEKTCSDVRENRKCID